MFACWGCVTVEVTAASVALLVPPASTDTLTCLSSSINHASLASNKMHLYTLVACTFSLRQRVL